jgi:hypothetical protein
MLKKFLVTICCFIILFCSSSYGDEINQVPVSMMKLLIEPQKYEGKRVYLSGYLHIGKGDYPRLYFSEESYQMRATEYLVLHGLKKLTNNKDFSGCYIYLLGTFEFEKYGKPISMIGVLDNLEHYYIFEGEFNKACLK